MHFGIHQIREPVADGNPNYAVKTNGITVERWQSLECARETTRRLNNIARRNAVMRTISLQRRAGRSDCDIARDLDLQIMAVEFLGDHQAEIEARYN